MFDRVFRVYVVGQMCPIELFWIEKTFILERYWSADKNRQCPLWLIFEAGAPELSEVQDSKTCFWAGRLLGGGLFSSFLGGSRWDAQRLFQQHPARKVQIVVVWFSSQAALHQLQKYGFIFQQFLSLSGCTNSKHSHGWKNLKLPIDGTVW